jgi:hypothetical protein
MSTPPNRVSKNNQFTYFKQSIQQQIQQYRFVIISKTLSESLGKLRKLIYKLRASDYDFSLITPSDL